jgi:hypothetical protein
MEHRPQQTSRPRVTAKVARRGLDDAAISRAFLALLGGLLVLSILLL